jgi:hypothetical protein
VAEPIALGACQLFQLAEELQSTAPVSLPRENHRQTFEHGTQALTAAIDDLPRQGDSPLEEKRRASRVAVLHLAPRERSQCTYCCRE